MENSNDYIRGYNSGYQISEHYPELIPFIEKHVSIESVYVEGLIDGILTYRRDHENQLDRLQEIDDIREGKEKEKEKAKENDKNQEPILDIDF